MPRDAVSRTANVERTGRHKWVKLYMLIVQKYQSYLSYEIIIFPYYNIYMCIFYLITQIKAIIIAFI